MSLVGAKIDQEKLNDLSDYFHGAPIGLKIVTATGTITRTNLAELTLLGYQDHEEEFVGHHIAEFYADPDEMQALLDRLGAGEQVMEHETTLRRRDGTRQKVLMYANAKTDHGDFRGMRCFTFPHPDDLRPDVAEVGALTDRSVESRGLTLTQEQQDEMYSELSDFFDNSPVNLHIVGGDGLVKHASKSELTSMGYDKEAYVGQHIARFHADQAVINGMLGTLVDGTPLVNFGATLFHKDGSKLPVMIYSNSRMRDGGFLNTRCFTVSLPRMRRAPAERTMEFAWPQNEDLGFTVPGRTDSGSQSNPMTLALKYIGARKRPEESLGFLAHISQALGSQRSFDAMLGEAAVLCVPFLADLVSIDVTDRHLVHSSTAALRPKVDALVDFLRAPEADARFCVAAVRSAGAVAVRFDLRSEDAADGERGKRLLELGIGSLIIVPLTIRGRHIGTIALLRESAPSRRSFGPADLALGEELARRLSFAIEIENLSNRA